MPTKPMTAKQKRLHAYLTRYRKRHGYNPSIREMAEAMGVTRTPILVMLQTMERAGYVRIEPGLRGAGAV